MYTYANQYSYPLVSSLRYDGDVNMSLIQTLTQAIIFITAYELSVRYGEVPDLSYDNYLTDFHTFTGHNCSDMINECVCDLRNYTFDSDTNESYDIETRVIVASVAKSKTDFTALVQVFKKSTLNTETIGPMGGIPCGGDFSPDYWPSVEDPSCEETYRGPVDESACGAPSEDSSESETIECEYYLIVNGTKLHTFKTDDGSNCDSYYEGAGYGFIRKWDEPRWIMIGTTLGRRSCNPEDMFDAPTDLNTVTYQLWDDLSMEKLDEVEFDYVDPGAPFLAALDRWEDGYQANWHNVTDKNGNTILAPNGQPVICSGHFRCFRSIETGERVNSKYSKTNEPQVWPMDF